MFTPEREHESTRMREYTPKTPLRRLKMDEDDLTPLSLRKADTTLGEYFEKIDKLKRSVDMHIGEAIKVQKQLINAINSSLSFATEYERSDEIDRLKHDLKAAKKQLNYLEGKGNIKSFGVF